MPFIFTISNTPRIGDQVILHLEDGNGVEAAYTYDIEQGDSVQDVVDALMGLVNAGVLFTAEPQAEYVQPGLLINQVTTNNYGGFSGDLQIILGAESASPAQTISFDEESNAFESFLSYAPEMFGVIGTLMLAYKGGDLYTFDSDTYNQFFGEDYESTVTFVFNDKPLLKKTWNSISQVGEGIFDAPLIYTDTKSYAAQRQESNLLPSDFILMEDNPTAAFLRDINSIGGIIDGEILKGNLCVVKLRKQDAGNLIYLSLVSARYINSPNTGV